jgi:hypothetical protein
MKPIRAAANSGILEKALLVAFLLIFTDTTSYSNVAALPAIGPDADGDADLAADAASVTCCDCARLGVDAANPHAIAPQRTTALLLFTKSLLRKFNFVAAFILPPIFCTEIYPAVSRNRRTHEASPYLFRPAKQRIPFCLEN